MPFARYITRTNVNYLKRYSIDRVYRRKKTGGFHPRELTECAFDIVTSSMRLVVLCWVAVGHLLSGGVN